MGVLACKNAVPSPRELVRGWVFIGFLSSVWLLLLQNVWGFVIFGKAASLPSLTEGAREVQQLSAVFMRCVCAHTNTQCSHINPLPVGNQAKNVAAPNA